MTWKTILAAALAPRAFYDLLEGYFRENPEAERYVERLIQANREADEETLSVAAVNLGETLGFWWPEDGEEAYDMLVSAFPVGLHEDEGTFFDPNPWDEGG